MFSSPQKLFLPPLKSTNENTEADQKHRLLEIISDIQISDY